MCAIMRAFVLFVITMCGAFGDQEVSSPLRVAQCRATCLQKFSKTDRGGESSCLQGADCFLCWENCELLQSNYQVWGSMCEDKDICFPGCREACNFHTEADISTHQSQPVIHTKGEGVVRISGPLARWPPPGSNTDDEEPLVYVVMRKSADGPWRQIIQTIALSTRVPIDNKDALLRVLVVDPRGLVTIYSPDETWTGKESEKIHSDHPWKLNEVSLIHQKVLVIGEIAWEPRTLRGVYLVTWEIDGGGLKGNLFTDSTRVTLSLWPDTIYHIRVELVSRAPGVDNEKSETMTIDTSRAQRVSTESTEDVSVNVESENELYSVLVSSRLAERTRRSELVLGFSAAVLLFVGLLAIISWKRRNLNANSIRRRKLLEEFVPNTHHVRPVIIPDVDAVV